MLSRQNLPSACGAESMRDFGNFMSLVIKTPTTEIFTHYEGEYPDGAVVYQGTLNGNPIQRAIPTEWNPPSSRPTATEEVFNDLVSAAGVEPHLRVKRNGEMQINFTGEGYPVKLSPRRLPSEVRGTFHHYFVVTVPEEAEAERSAILLAEAERRRAIKEWLDADLTREEWEYGMEWE